VLPHPVSPCAFRLPGVTLQVGHDPVTYFLAFARLAPAQVAWYGHPDTTGVAAVDYFVSSDVEVGQHGGAALLACPEALALPGALAYVFGL